MIVCEDISYFILGVLNFVWKGAMNIKGKESSGMTMISLALSLTRMIKWSLPYSATIAHVFDEVRLLRVYLGDVQV